MIPIKTTYIRHTISSVLWEKPNGDMEERNMLYMENISAEQVAADVMKGLVDDYDIRDFADLINFIRKNKSGN